MQATQDTEVFIPAFSEIEPGAYRVQSKSHLALSHTVRVTASGLKCSCPAGRHPSCWHRRYVQSFLDFEEIYNRMNEAANTPPDDDPEPPMPTDPLSGIRKQLEKQYRGDVDGFDAAWEAVLWDGPMVEPKHYAVEHISGFVLLPNGKKALDFTRNTEPVTAEMAKAA